MTARRVVRTSTAQLLEKQGLEENRDPEKREIGQIDHRNSFYDKALFVQQRRYTP